MGIFGGIGRALSKPGAGGLSMGERLAIFATAANGDFGSAMAIRNSPMLRAKEAQKQQFAQMLAGKLGPQYAETQGAGDAVMAGGDYQWKPPERTSNGLDINSPDLPALALQADTMGVDMSKLLDVLKAQKKDLKQASDGSFYDPSNPSLEGTRTANRTNINGWVTDLNNPANEGRYMPNLPEGMMPDGKGNVVYPGGLVPQLAQREGAIAAAKAAGTAPYEFISTPSLTGAPQVRAKSTAAGGVFTGQTPVEAIQAEGAARGDVERTQAVQDRAASAGKQLSSLDEMETLLPDVISGFGADARLQAARALAAAGNERAQKQVAATETFINQGRVLVASIIKTFGSNPTEGERKFAETMSGADAALNPETLKEGIRLQRLRIYRDLQDAGKPLPQAKPAPPTAAGRARNEIYQTPRGPLRWTGTGWVQP